MGEGVGAASGRGDEEERGVSSTVDGGGVLWPALLACAADGWSAGESLEVDVVSVGGSGSTGAVSISDDPVDIKSKAEGPESSSTGSVALTPSSLGPSPEINEKDDGPESTSSTTDIPPDEVGVMFMPDMPAGVSATYQEGREGRRALTHAPKHITTIAGHHTVEYRLGGHGRRRWSRTWRVSARVR